jgi:beta-phosphoglucomutase-like phosphatase (HAD superfamily)
MRFTGAIFDVDGVLVDSPHERAWRDALERLMGLAWTELAGQTHYAPEKFTTEVYQAYVAGKPREAGARAALEHFGIPDPDGRRVAEYMAVKQADLIALIERGQFTAFEDALRFLLDLKAAGLRIAAASSSKNADIFLRKVALGKWAGAAAPTPAPAAAGERSEQAAPSSQQELGASTRPRPPQREWEPGGEGQLYPFLRPDSTLLEMFDADVCGRDFARGKPDPEIFLTAAAELGLPPEQCVVIEDAQSGVQAAKAGGMACIGVARLGDAALLRSAGADWVVTSLDELPVGALER